MAIITSATLLAITLWAVHQSLDSYHKLPTKRDKYIMFGLALLFTMLAFASAVMLAISVSK